MSSTMLTPRHLRVRPVGASRRLVGLVAVASMLVACGGTGSSSGPVATAAPSAGAQPAATETW